MDRETHSDVRPTGTTHFFAIDGLHIVILAEILITA